ncbi:hypothetical protein [Formicincola oecophyllae]|nr:hypothetical protein [Formicincola oecophyllae]
MAAFLRRFDNNHQVTLEQPVKPHNLSGRMAPLSITGFTLDMTPGPKGKS